MHHKKWSKTTDYILKNYLEHKLKEEKNSKNLESKVLRFIEQRKSYFIKANGKYSTRIFKMNLETVNAFLCAYTSNW